MELGGPKEPCVRWGPGSLREGTIWGNLFWFLYSIGNIRHAVDILGLIRYVTAVMQTFLSVLQRLVYSNIVITVTLLRN